MIKVVLDANVFASALLSPYGKPAKILDYVLDSQIRLVASLPIIEEVERVLNYPKLAARHGLAEEGIRELLYGFLGIITMVEDDTPVEVIEVIKEDPSDNKYLLCSDLAGADFIVSGDAHLLKLGNYKGIQIVTPAQFLDLVE